MLEYVHAGHLRKYSLEFLNPCPGFSSCRLDSCIPEHVCPFLLHALIPYYITYLNGGNFTWSKEEGSVLVQCPNPKGKVVVKLLSGVPFRVTVESATTHCPMRYCAGATFNLSEIFKALCPSVFDVSFAWIQHGSPGKLTLRCPGCSKCKGVSFILRGG